jgi:hypothetical protein
MAARHRAYHVRVETKNGSGTWKDLTNLHSVDWVDSVQWGEHIDQPVGSGSVTLKRSVRGISVKSLSPLMQTSIVNRLDDGVTYAPILDAARAIRVLTAINIPGTGRPGSSSPDWKEVFRGKIDDIAWESDPVVIAMRDDGAPLLDAFIEDERIYGTVAGIAVQTEMQKILDDNMSIGAYSLVTPVNPLWNVTQWAQDQTHVLEALRALAMQIGHDVRFVWDASNNFVLTFSLPQRAKDAWDAVFGPDEYFDVTQLSVSDADVRNVGKGRFFDKATQTVQTILRTNDASIARYGRRYMEIVEGATSNIDSAAEMTAMLDAMLADLALPIAEQSISTSYFWPAQLGDLYMYRANGVHYDTDQLYALVGYEHAAQDGEIVTTMTSRGKPAGAYREWLAIEGVSVRGRSIASPPFSVTRQVRSTETGGALSAVITYTPIVDPLFQRIEFHQRSRPSNTSEPYGPIMVVPGSNEGSDYFPIEYHLDYEITLIVVTAQGVLTPIASRQVRTIASGGPPQATPLIGVALQEPTRVRFPLTWDIATKRIEVYYETFATDPGPVQSRWAVATATKLSPDYHRNDNRTEIIVPMNNPYAWVTFVPFDAWDTANVPGLIHRKVQTGAPLAPADITTTPAPVPGYPTATEQQVDLTMPAAV